jgi:tetraprenyl-beta-curcumene synthase
MGHVASSSQFLRGRSTRSRRIAFRAQPTSLFDLLLDRLVLVATVVRCVALVLPEVRRERRRWGARVESIPSEELQRAARTAHAKRGNVEGAALFGVLAPRAYRRDAIRALVALQSAYNYLDELAEQPSADPHSNARRLHLALLAAVSPEPPYLDHYAYNPENEDGGYLAALIDACRESLLRLPGYALFAPPLAAAAMRTVDFQALNLPESQGGQASLESWARALTLTAAGQGIAWWEVAAGAGSSLALHALIATAAGGELDSSIAMLVDDAYFPTIGALHSLLDSVVDRDEDREKGQRSLLANYPSPVYAAARIAMLAGEARDACAPLPAPRTHRVILTAMCSYYLSARQPRTTESRLVRANLLDALGFDLHVAIAMFAVKRSLARLSGPVYG